MSNVRYLTPEDHNRAVRVAPLDSIIAEVSALTGVHERLIRGRSRERIVVKARWLAWSVAHREGMSFAEIGRRMGFDHTSVLYGVRREEALRRHA